MLWKHLLPFNNGGFHKTLGGGWWLGQSVDGEISRCRCYSPRTPANKGLGFGDQKVSEIAKPTVSTFSRPAGICREHSHRAQAKRSPDNTIQLSARVRCVSMFDRLHARGPGIIPSFERGHSYSPAIKRLCLPYRTGQETPSSLVRVCESLKMRDMEWGNQS